MEPTDPIVILTGAGISAESGLGTFRDKGGLWSQYDLEEVATPEGFARNPALVHDFYNARRANCRTAGPNDAHHALARLEQNWPGPVCVVTQNVDDLHERAGSQNVVHMHGQLTRALCAACGQSWDAPLVMDPADPCPACAAKATRPDIVWFGEMPYHMDFIAQALADCALFVAIGTSGQVYPAAGFASEAAAAGAVTRELNLERSDTSHLFDRVTLGKASDIVPAFVSQMLRRV
ncbi:MAG TPA: NAD-dependent deacylase [Aliiroseovarius sp.]|nr:NAD-dependent deacylase [Aliiroseovarius sp.]